MVLDSYCIKYTFFFTSFKYLLTEKTSEILLQISKDDNGFAMLDLLLEVFSHLHLSQVPPLCF